MAWGAYQKRTCHNKQLTSPQRVYIIDERTRHSAVRTHRARVRFKVIHRAPFLHNRHPSRDPKCYQKAGYIKLSRKKVISPQCVGFTHYRAHNIFGIIKLERQNNQKWYQYHKYDPPCAAASPAPRGEGCSHTGPHLRRPQWQAGDRVRGLVVVQGV